MSRMFFSLQHCTALYSVLWDPVARATHVALVAHVETCAVCLQMLMAASQAVPPWMQTAAPPSCTQEVGLCFVVLWWE